MVLKYICILFILMVGCSSNTNMYENKDSLNFSLVSEKLFYDVKYDFVEVIVKYKVENYNVFVSKKDMSIEFYNSTVTKRIKDMGWEKVKSTYENQDIYCYDEKNEMAILYPTKQNYSSKDGKNGFSITKKYLDYWVVYYRFKDDGTNNCKYLTLTLGQR